MDAERGREGGRGGERAFYTVLVIIIIFPVSIIRASHCNISKYISIVLVC